MNVLTGLTTVTLTAHVVTPVIHTGVHVLTVILVTVHAVITSMNVMETMVVMPMQLASTLQDLTDAHAMLISKETEPSVAT